MSEQRGYTRKELQTFARRHGIDVFEEKQGVLAGWQGKPRGLLEASPLGEGVDFGRIVSEVYIGWTQGCKIKAN